MSSWWSRNHKLLFTIIRAECQLPSCHFPPGWSPYQPEQHHANCCFDCSVWRQKKDPQWSCGCLYALLFLLPFRGCLTSPMRKDPPPGSLSFLFNLMDTICIKWPSEIVSVWGMAGILLYSLLLVYAGPHLPSITPSTVLAAALLHKGIKRDIITASLLKEASHNVTTEPTLQPLSSENLHPRSAITDDNARSDIKADGCWSCDQQSSFFDIKIFNRTALTYRTKPLPSCYHHLEDSK